MNQYKLADKIVFVFDAFGTLFRTEPVNDQLKSIIGRKTNNLLQVWRTKQLEYSWLRNQMWTYIPFDEITKDALTFAMSKLNISDARVYDILLPIYDNPSLIKGAKELLMALKEKEKTLCILSNGTQKMLENGIIKTGIDTLIDELVSVDQIGIYKPDPRIYRVALRRLNVQKKQVVFFSSNQWDVSGASNYGFDTVWVNQYDEPREQLPFGVVEEVDSLGKILKVL